MTQSIATQTEAELLTEGLGYLSICAHKDDIMQTAFSLKLSEAHVRRYLRGDVGINPETGRKIYDMLRELTLERIRSIEEKLGAVA